MLDDLDATLRAVLSDPAAPASLRAADVSFDTPDSGYRPARATVNLFLRDVAENRDLRDPTRTPARTGPGYERRQPSVRVDCTYLVTAWSAHAAALKAQEEHHLLGLVLVWLCRFPVIGTSHVQGSLQGPPEPEPLPTVLARGDGQALSHFWSALGSTPRPCLTLVVTVSLAPFDEVERFPGVHAVQLRTTSVDHPELTGRVLDHELVPVAGAVVTLTDQDGGAVAVRTTDVQGRFAFADVGFAAYRLGVQAQGHPGQERSVLYARDRQVHDVVVPEQ